jgi:VWFA-related protein
MYISSFPLKLRWLAALIFCSCLLTIARAQDAPPPPPPPPTQQQTPSDSVDVDEEDTIRISTELIQTGVTVFDKQGRFNDRLNQEDFELRVDGKPVDISFFERVAVKRGAARAALRDNVKAEGAAMESGRGRTVIFLVDDLHLAADSHKRTREMLRRFIDKDMEQDDLTVIASTSGKVGFLQQFTDDKTVLRAAVERLKFNRDYSAVDRLNPPMSEYEALLIDRNDYGVTQSFIGAYLSQNMAFDADDARIQIQSRARNILQQVGITSRGTYKTLERLVRRSAQLPGRKVVFFISDGFFLDTTNTDSSSLLKRITDAASRANAVIYSFDTKGLDAALASGSYSSAARSQSSERWEFQDPLNALAENTGGRFIHNTNDLQTGMLNALEESSLYYVLAWRPETGNRGPEKFRRIEVSVKGHPDLRVRVQSGYLEEESPTATPAKGGEKIAGAAATPADLLNKAWRSMIPRQALPTSVVANYIDVPKEGPLLAIALQIKGSAVEFTQANDKATADVDIVGVIFNSQGKREGYFNNRLTVTRAASTSSGFDRSDVYYNYQARLKPGLYQIRTAARDVKSGRVGSAVQWVEIPDLASHKLALSSLLVGERTEGAKQELVGASVDMAPAGVRVSVDRRFSNTSHLRLALYIYNARAGKARPDVVIQTQVLRGDAMVMTTPLRQVSAEGQDPTQLGYAAEVPLSALPVGRYALQVTAVDRLAKTSATRRVNFEIQ